MADTDIEGYDPAAQEARRKEAAEKQKLDRKLEVDDLKWTMSNKRSRRVMHGILAKAGVWRLSFNTNALQMAFNEGSRNVGLVLLASLLEHCPELYELMLKESRND